MVYNDRRSTKLQVLKTLTSITSTSQHSHVMLFSRIEHKVSYQRSILISRCHLNAVSPNHAESAHSLVKDGHASETTRLQSVNGYFYRIKLRNKMNAACARKKSTKISSGQAIMLNCVSYREHLASKWDLHCISTCHLQLWMNVSIFDNIHNITSLTSGFRQSSSLQFFVQVTKA